MESLHKNIKDTWLKHRIPWRKRVGGRENKGNLGTDETNTIEKNWYLILQMLQWSDPLEEKTRRLKRIDKTDSMIKKD